MADTKWTKEQQAAIWEKDCNLLVAAAAGAGKTAVLVERIIQKIIDDENPIDIDSLLVVTFTNAAATEMRERIGTAISKAIDQNKASRNIHRQLALLNKASITTIHSFCLEVIRNNFQSIDIDPNFRILDETEASLMKLETLNELFENIYEDENNEVFFDLLESYGTNRGDERLQEMVLNIYSFIQSYPWPEQWLLEQTESFNPGVTEDFGSTEWGRVILKTVRLRAEGFISMLETACNRLKYAAGLEKYLPLFHEDLDKLSGLLKLLDTGISNDKLNWPREGSSVIWDDIYNYLSGCQFGRLPNCGKEADKQLQEQVKKIRDEVKAFIKELKDELFYQKSEEIISDLKKMYPLLKYLSSLVLEFGKKYSDKKRLKAAVDFSDLEHFCLKILSEEGENGKPVPSPVAAAYKDKFTEILVDEYQDSNMVQEIIINMISREDRGKPNVFMVGDVKQSIYRFRQAKPELFMSKYNSYSSEAFGLYRKILLFKNFRSRKEVVDGVNFIFEQIMSESVGELDYDEYERLNPAAIFPDNIEENVTVGGDVELHLIETTSVQNYEDNLVDEEEQSGDQAENGEEEEILDNIQKEARMVACRIKELMQPDKDGRRFCVYDKQLSQYREVQYKDIVILLRTTKNWTEVFCEELARFGIPVFADTGSGFFKTPEIQVMLSLLQIIDNPYQDIPLLSVLRSQIGNFTTEDLAELRLSDRKAPMFDALNLLAESTSEASGKAAEFLERLKKWRGMAMYMPTHKLIWQLYNETGYFSIVGAMKDGERKQANLRILFERALQFEKTSYKGLFNFISFIDKLKTSKGDMGSAKVLGENDNVVRMMSIHKSKGLEFPVVLVSGCGKKFNFQDMHKSILLHQELGLGPDLVDHLKRIKYPSVPKLAIAQKVRFETLSEEMRILYVALTRAREKLILTGSVNSIEKAAAKWLSVAGSKQLKFPAHEMAKAQNYLDWICPAVMRHKNALNLRLAGGTGADVEMPEVSKDSLWTVHIRKDDFIKGTPILEGGTDEENDCLSITDLLDNIKSCDKDTAAEVSRRLSWNYPYLKLTEVPSKFSVTEIKRFFKLNDEGEDRDILRQNGIKKPAFLQEKKGLSSAEKGTVLHFVMQHLNLKNRNIKTQIEDMVKRNLITQQQADSIAVRKIIKFMDSDICRRITSAEKVYKEVPFNLEIPYAELYDQEEQPVAEDTILLQGVIDCYFEENGEIVLIDYKTDYIEPGNYDKLKDRYEIQLSYYSRALEKLTGKKVKERYIYLFSTSEFIEM